MRLTDQEPVAAARRLPPERGDFRISGRRLIADARIEVHARLRNVGERRHAPRLRGVIYLGKLLRVIVGNRTFDPRMVTTRFPAQYSSIVAVVFEMGSSTRRTRCSGLGNRAFAANATGAMNTTRAAAALRPLPPFRQSLTLTGEPPPIAEKWNGLFPDRRGC